MLDGSGPNVAFHLALGGRVAGPFSSAFQYWMFFDTRAGKHISVEAFILSSTLVRELCDCQTDSLNPFYDRVALLENFVKSLLMLLML